MITDIQKESKPSYTEQSEKTPIPKTTPKQEGVAYNAEGMMLIFILLAAFSIIVSFLFV